MKNQYIFIAGHNRVGKGTVADNVQGHLENQGYRVHRIALADALKELTLVSAYAVFLNMFLPADIGTVKELIPYTHFVSMMNQHKEHIFRPLLQGYGEMARQLIKDSYWLDQLLADTIHPTRKHGPLMVLVDDCRYPNEADFVRGVGGLLIGVAGYNRDKYSSAYSSRKLLDTQYGDHPSVQGVCYCMEKADIVVGNTGNMSQLREAVRLQVFQHPSWVKFMERVDADWKPQATSESGTIRQTHGTAPDSPGDESEPTGKTGSD